MFFLLDAPSNLSHFAENGYVRLTWTTPISTPGLAFSFNYTYEVVLNNTLSKIEQSTTDDTLDVFVADLPHECNDYIWSVTAFSSGTLSGAVATSDNPISTG